jgi:hypothetical protein
MPRGIHLQPYLTDHELHEQYRQAHDPVERSRWRFLWLFLWLLARCLILQTRRDLVRSTTLFH